MQWKLRAPFGESMGSFCLVAASDFFSTTGTVNDYKWNKYSTTGRKLPSQYLLAPALRIVIALLSEIATRT